MLSELYIHCFEDLEYNLKCIKNGLTNYILPSKHYAIHSESVTRKQQSKYFDGKDYYVIRDYILKNFKKI